LQCPHLVIKNILFSSFKINLKKKVITKGHRIRRGLLVST
jgi:hypothetical protein